MTLAQLASVSTDICLMVAQQTRWVTYMAYGPESNGPVTQ